MAQVILFSSQKGGSGKSTSTLICAVAASLQPFNLKVIVLDLDQQNSLYKARRYDSKAYSIRKEDAPFEILDYSINDLQKNIFELDKTHDFIFIDTAGAMDNTQPIENQTITKVLQYADFVFIPISAGNFVIDATVEYFRFLKKIQAIRSKEMRKLKVYGFINLHRARTIKANQILNNEIIALTKNEGLVMLKNALNDYSLISNADTILSIYDQHSSNPAKVNFALFFNEFLNIIRL